MTLPSNAEVAAVLRDLFGQEVIMQGPPATVAGAMLTVMRTVLAATQEQPKQLSDYTDAELGWELHRRAARVLGDPRKGVSFPSSERDAQT